MKRTNSQKAVQLLIELDDIEPPVWRRILVSEHIDLSDLHEIIQVVFDWLNYHLHEFTIHGERYGDLECDVDCNADLRDETETELRELGLAEGESFGYLYDFGDSWHHLIRVERITPADTRVEPRCIAGQRACPPEDVGGTGGYADFLEAIANPDDPEHRTLLVWAGGVFDPEAFDLGAVNQRLAERERVKRAGRWGLPFGPEGTADGRVRMPLVKVSPTAAGHERTAHDLVLRRDVLSLMAYLRDHRVTGTSSTGNLSLKAVADVAALFVNPPVLETKIGDRVFRYRSEEEVFQVLFAHRVANGAGLVYGGPGLRWRLTQKGEVFFSENALVQVFTLFHAWWYRVNWLVVTRFDIFGDSLSPAVPLAALHLLREKRPGQAVEYSPFIDRLIEEVGWVWDTEKPEDTLEWVRGEMEKMLIRTLEDFGVLVTEQVTERLKAGTGYYERSTLVSFSLTDFGRVLIDGL